MSAKKKKIVNTIIITLAVVIFVINVVICSKKNKVMAANIPITVADEIKILEIEPANDFLLGTNKLGILDTQDVVINKQTENQKIKKVKITHYSMPQFISMVDEINGQYDIVVIGRKYVRNNYNYSAQKTKGGADRFGDYSNPFSKMMQYLPVAQNVNLSQGSTVDNMKMEEYYSENDITNRRAEGIIKMLDSGQTVYMDDAIFNQTENSIDKSKLYKNFIDRDIKRFRQEEISLEKIVTDYENEQNVENKRIKVTSYIKPEDDANNNAGLASKNMKFSIKFNDAVSEQVQIKLYLDINADGLYKETELAKTIKMNTTIGDNECKLSYNLTKDFIGFLDWKIEIIKSNNVKSSILDSSIYRSNGENKRNIRVLQICPDNVINDSKFNLSKNNEFQKLLKPNDNNSNNKICDYNINLKTIKTTDFNKDVASGKIKLNEEYDMVILGFADMYGPQEFTVDACKMIDNYIQTGQSVMLTHDTVARDLIVNDSGGYYNRHGGSRLLTRWFRDYIGQSRYIDQYKSVENADANLDEDIYSEYEIFKNSSGHTSEIKYEPRKMKHDEYSSNGVVNLGNTNDGKFINENSMWDGINYINRINKAQISSYPYVLRENMRVAWTHTQYFQLNLEDPDIVPWFNLSGNNFNEKDSRNYYYTYSKGNLTFSGTGHSNGFTDDELMLFINTIVKAERGANHAPEIQCDIPSEYKEESKVLNNVPANVPYTFNVNADDFDGDPVEMKIKIDGNELTEENIDMSKLEETSHFHPRKDEYGQELPLDKNVFEVDTSNEHSIPLKITIPGDKLDKDVSGVTVEITAIDYRGAKAATKTYKLKPVEIPDFNINVTLDTDRLKKVDNSGNLLDSQVEENTITIDENDKVNVSYKIEPELKLLDRDKSEYSKKEIAILIDASMEPNNLRSQCLNGITNNIIDNNKIFDNYNASNSNLSLIVYGSNKAERVEVKNYNSDYRDKFKNEVNRALDANYYPQDQSNTEPKLKEAINLAIESFNENEWSDSSKTIILISNREINTSSVESIKDTVNTNYNVITLDISEDVYDQGNDNFSKDEHEMLINKHKNLKQVHKMLGGREEDYFVSKGDSKSSPLVHNDVPRKIGEIAKNIAYIKYATFIMSDIYLNFNLGQDIDLITGLEKKNQNTDDKQYIKGLPDVKYVARVDENGEVKYENGKITYDGYFLREESGDTKKYNLDFTIKPNESAIDKCEFIYPNYISYDYRGYDIHKQSEINTPILNLNNTEVEHGVYKSISNNKINFEGNRKEIAYGQFTFENSNKVAMGSVVTFGANIAGISSNKSVKIKIDDDSTIDKIYKLSEEGQLQEVSLPDKAKKEFVISNDDNRENMVIVYSVILGDKQKNYTNYIITDREVPASIDTSEIPLPDLF